MTQLSAFSAAQSRHAARFSQRKSSLVNVGDSERWLSLLAGGALASVGALRGRWDGLLALGLGSGLIYRGLTGYCHFYQSLGFDTSESHARQKGVPAQQGVKVEQTMIIERPAADLFSFWQNLERLPGVFEHLKAVQPQQDGRSHWVARGPFDMEIAWDAEIINEQPNRLIAWRSLPGGDIETAGSVRFEPAGSERATAVTVSMKYNPPAGQIGAAVASWLGTGLEQVLANDLQRFRQQMESQTADKPGYHAQQSR